MSQQRARLRNSSRIAVAVIQRTRRRRTASSASWATIPWSQGRSGRLGSYCAHRSNARAVGTLDGGRAFLMVNHDYLYVRPVRILAMPADCAAAATGT